MMNVIMASPGEGALESDKARQDAGVPRHVYPEPLTEDNLAAMDEILSDEATAAHLRWLETGEGDPWGGHFG